MTVEGRSSLRNSTVPLLCHREQQLSVFNHVRQTLLIDCWLHCGSIISHRYHKLFLHIYLKIVP